VERELYRSGAVAGVAGLVALLGWLYAPVLRDMAAQWAVDTTYGYGYYIPPVAAYLVWERRRALAATRPKGTWLGLPVLLIGLGALVLGRAGGIALLSRISLVPVLFGLVLLLGGGRMTRLAAFPILFLAVMIPIPSGLLQRLTWPLQIFTAQFSTEVLRLMGYPVYLEGVYIDLPHVRLEVAEAFRKRGLEVTLLEAKERPLPHWDEEVGTLLKGELERHGVEVWTGVRVLAIGGAGRVEAVETSEGVVPADLVLVATGVRPNTELAQAMGVALGPTGAIATDQEMRTNLEGVFAAGDVAESFHRVLGRPYWLPLGDVANKHGRTAGSVIAGKEALFHGVVGTAIFKAFGLAVATTGLPLEAALKEGYRAKKVFIQSRDGAHYYPGSAPLWVELVYEEGTGRLLGGAVVAHGHGALRVDVLAALLHRGGTLEDLLALDLAYAPPYSPVWDPLLIAAQQAR